MRTIETLWVWSWSQIASVFSMTWGNLPGWKLALGLVAMMVLAAMLVVMFMRGLRAFRRIAAAFWTMALTMVGILTFVMAAGLFSRGFTWVAASVPDNFWEKLL
jgi:C4-dicarboxylate transporter